jgi:hypothetical protein
VSQPGRVAGPIRHNGPVARDPWGVRLPDIAALAELFGTADHLDYPCLTREQLLAVADRPVVTDARDLQWWQDLDDRTRTELVEAGQRSLLAADHVRLDPERPSDLVLSPAVQAIVAIRSAPAFVSVAGGERLDQPALRCFGVRMDQPAGPEDFAVLLEARITRGVSEFILGTARYAAVAVTRFVLAPPAPGDPDAVEVDEPLGRVLVRRLQLFPPGTFSGGQRLRLYAGLTAGAVEELADDDSTTGPVSTTEADLVDRILTSWQSAVAAGMVGTSS